MYSKINYTLVGLFVLIFTVLALGFAFWLAKYGFEEQYDLYRIYFDEPVDGLTIDSTVKLKGVDVGKVNAIELDPKNIERIRVLIRLKHGTPVTRGMYAVLKLQGITGLSYVQIEGGKRGEALLKPKDDEIPVIPARHSLSYQLAQKAPELLHKLDSAVERFNTLLSEHNQAQLSRILDHTASATAKALVVEDRIIALSDELNTTLRHFDRRTEDLKKGIDRIVVTLDEELPPVMKNIRSAGENISRVARGIDRRLKRGEYDLRKIVRPLEVDLSELSYRYQELAEDLKNLSRHPSSLIFGGARPPKGPGE
ncbi:MlaD family protein [Nitratifractor sp.]